MEGRAEERPSGKAVNRCSLDMIEITPEMYYQSVISECMTNVFFAYVQSFERVRSAVLDGLLPSNNEMYSPEQVEHIDRWAVSVQKRDWNGPTTPKARGLLTHMFRNLRSFVELRTLMIQRQRESELQHIVDDIQFYANNEIFLV